MKLILIALISVVFLTVCSLASFVAGYVCGSKARLHDEIRLCTLTLTQKRAPEGTMLHEYLKAKYYFLSRFVANDVFAEECHDFGPVNTNIFLGISVGPESHSRNDYDNFVLRMHKSGINMERSD